jgi:hypothetical protein
MILLFIGCFFLSFKFRAPFERMFIMMLDLQLMTHFALLSITMPANYLTMSAILKPFVSLNILRTYVGSNDANTLSSDLSEKDLAVLGQRV